MTTGLLPGLYAQSNSRRSGKKKCWILAIFDALSYCHGEILNYSAIARDCAIDAKTVRSYFEILVDTLIGYLIHPFQKRGSRQAISSAPKFYLFDVGIANYICGNTVLSTSGADFERSFEHFIFLELVAATSYQNLDTRIE